ncbi:MAG: hypothetical protein GY757_48095 [bacterium]|nr:hypothetical protein [bacterium]
MKRYILYSIVLVTLLGMTADGLSADISFSGYYKLFFTGFKSPGYESGDEVVTEPPFGSVSNRLRLNLKYRPSSQVSFEAAYDITPRIQDPQLFTGEAFLTTLEPFAYRGEDFSQRLYPKTGAPVSSLGVDHNLDRFFLTIRTANADIFIGRQPIGWGSGRMINPTDIIAPFAFNELDTEDRKGVDAVRVRIPLGTMSELDAGYVFGNKFKFENSAFFLRGKTYAFKTDIAVLMMGFRENLLVGLDVTRSIGGAGFWFETAYVEPAFFRKDENTSLETTTRPVWLDEDNYLRLSTGLEYKFGGKVYGILEYHFNSAGETNTARYDLVYGKTAYSEGTAYFLGKHYLNLGMTTELTPLMPFEAFLFINLGDGSLMLAPKLEYNIKEDIYLAVGAYLGIGKAPGTNGLEGGRIINSEFGAYPGMVFTSFRIYF